MTKIGDLRLDLAKTAGYKRINKYAINIVGDLSTVENRYRNEKKINTRFLFLCWLRVNIRSSCK